MKQTRNNNGSVLVLLSISLVMIFTMMAIVLDLGIMVSTHNELQNAADSASLAAASQLVDEDVLTGSANLTDDIIEARAYAEQFASYNVAAKRTLAVDRNDANDASGGVVVGYIDNPLDINDAIQTSGVTNYNSVQVQADLTNTLNGPLSMLLGAFSGKSQIAMRAQATATLEDRIAGFTLGPNETLPMLPFAAYAGAWEDALVSGPDNYRVVNGQVQSGSDGIPELTLYPYRYNIGVPGTRGNVGTIFISMVVGTSYVNNQIYDGMTAGDLATIDELLLVDNGGGGLSQWLPGENWMSSSWHYSLRNIRGEPRIMALYTAISSNNPTAYADPSQFDEPMSDLPSVETCCAIQQYYKATEFKAVTVVDSTWSSNSNYIRFVVQPTQITSDSAVVNPDAPHSELIYTLSLTR
ncbi:MAG: pilus assembly protein TadG-related protein [Candidatus Hinthialibacter antarcticus]|nr:pilus assembly protein TadG-related protein [Candidatus Hinthialibacter antarcticus]